MKITMWLSIALISSSALASPTDDPSRGVPPTAVIIEDTQEAPIASEIPEFLLPFDADEDGILSQEELGAARIALKERRGEKSTEWTARTADERSAEREAVRTELESKRTKHFTDAAGKDSLIDLDEFLQIGAFAKLADKSPKRAAAIFTHLDSDRDGFISSTEFLGNLRPVRPPQPKLTPTDSGRTSQDSRSSH